jgi:2-dehydropantoate 2-reductase
MAEVTVVGAGAIGGFVGARLAATGHDVTLVDAAADHVAAIRRDGLRVRGAADLHVRVPALAPEELAGRLGTVLLCVKARHTLAALEAVAPRLDDDGCVVSLQNGLEEHRIAKAIGAERTVGAFLTFGGYYAGPGQVVYGGPGSLRIGELDGVTRARTRALATLLRAAHPVEISDRIFALEWGKTALERSTSAPRWPTRTSANCSRRPRRCVSSAPSWRRSHMSRGRRASSPRPSTGSLPRRS